jgi:hypothetical protein
VGSARKKRKNLLGVQTNFGIANLDLEEDE